jgi:hypothetical protein
MINDILTNALNRLAQLDGLTTREIAVRCILTGTVPAVPAFTPDVIRVYAQLEADQVRNGTPAWAIQDALEGRR